MNVLQTKKHIRKLYDKAFKAIKKEFLNVLSPLTQEIYDELIALGYDGEARDINEHWLDMFFLSYNATTGYVFKNEFERKKSRLFESLIANQMLKEQNYKRAERLLVNQIKQYGIELEDAVLLDIYADFGVEKVEWVAEHDYRTCEECKELDGQVFSLDEIPDKHINCRCYLIPFNEE